MKPLNPMALFRLSVLGPLVNHTLEHGELQQIVRQLAQREYDIPGKQQRTRIGAKTIEAWYYTYRTKGIEGLNPQCRCDQGQSKLPTTVQEFILQSKKENASRSLRQLQLLLDASGLVAKDSVSRSAIHRLLQQQGLSKRVNPETMEEKRSFEAKHAGDIWYGDVMHAIKVPFKNQMRKSYLVSLMDDASRLVPHNAFCLGETALDIEGVLKQALLRRGVPRKLVVDNGSAYRSHSLQGICARLGIQLIYCRPYAPEGKGKLERWHRTFRDQFLSELDTRHIESLGDLNARLWAWMEQVYHQTPHHGLSGKTPLQRYQQDLPKIRSLGTLAPKIDTLFYHREKRLVRKNGTVSYNEQFFEVSFELVGQDIHLVVDPHTEQVIHAESLEGVYLGPVHPLDKQANLHRHRHRSSTPTLEPQQQSLNLIEIAKNQYYQGK